MKRNRLLALLLGILLGGLAVGLSLDEEEYLPSGTDADLYWETETTVPNMMEQSAETDAYRGESETEEVPESLSKMEVHFLDVGQGDATLILNDGHAMLIDAGDNSKGTAIQLYLTKCGVETLDYLILTHTDADHIGGADVILTKFEIDTVFMGDFPKENATYRDVLQALSYRGLTFSTPEVGSVYSLGDAYFTIVAPNGTYGDPNNTSIGLLLCKGDTTFLFTGDAEGKAEEDMLTNGLSLQADVYQVGHHGSSTSSSEGFLEAVAPTYAVISCAEGNSYGHPHAETLNTLRAMGVLVFRTDEQGSIVAVSDGSKITFNCAPSESWQAGEPTGY